jgi:hypothetical protein
VRSYLEKNPSQKRAGGVAQTPEFKPQYHQNKLIKSLVEWLKWWNACLVSARP